MLAYFIIASCLTLEPWDNFYDINGSDSQPNPENQRKKKKNWNHSKRNWVKQEKGPMRGQIISHTRMNFDPIQISRRSAQFPIHIMTNYMNELKKKRLPSPLERIHCTRNGVTGRSGRERYRRVTRWRKQNRKDDVLGSNAVPPLREENQVWWKHSSMRQQSGTNQYLRNNILNSV